MPKKEEIIYLAGFFDGDGCITTSPKTNFRLTISNTNKEILDWIKKNFGGNINNQHLPKNPKHNTSWKWITTKRTDVLRILELIYPYLIVKKKQAKLIINYLNYHKNENKVYPIVKEKLRRLKTDKRYFRGNK